MVEIPAAVLILPSLLRLFDFVSLGTNDLIQYTLAIDRADESVSHLYDPWHPAVLSLIAQTIRQANAAGKGVSVCGEMAGDPEFTELLLAMGLRSFSMHPVADRGDQADHLASRCRPLEKSVELDPRVRRPEGRQRGGTPATALPGEQPPHLGGNLTAARGFLQSHTDVCYSRRLRCEHQRTGRSKISPNPIASPVPTGACKADKDSG